MIKILLLKENQAMEGKMRTHVFFLKLRFGQLSRVHSELGEAGKDVTWYANVSFRVFKQPRKYGLM